MKNKPLKRTINNMVVGKNIKFEYTKKHFIGIAIALCTIIYVAVMGMQIFIVNLEPFTEENIEFSRDAILKIAAVAWVGGALANLFIDRPLRVKIKQLLK